MPTSPERAHLPPDPLHQREQRRQLWASLGDMIAELAAYLGQPVDLVRQRCQHAAVELAHAWRTAAPLTSQAVDAFYRETDLYLYDLTWWHMLQVDDSALIQVRALEVALERRARIVLDFGSGIGSLGLLLAQHGLSVTLADVNDSLNEYAHWRFARRGLSAHIINLSTDTLPAAAFDVISAVDVFEHLPDPQHTLARLAAALRLGGTLFIHLPPDTSGTRPMHLWNDPTVLFSQMQECGLWLDKYSEADGIILLRRGDGPRYALMPALDLVPDTQNNPSGVLLAMRPLLAMRLNAQAFALLSQLKQLNATGQGATALEVASAVGMPPLEVTIFLDTLAQRRLLSRKPPLPEQWPFVSIILPAYGRPAATRACIESLLALDYPPEFLEIIVVDDASDPPLAPVLADLPVRLLRQEQNIGQSAARNLAAARAHGELLAFIDNDCVAAPRWLRALVPYLDDPTIGIVGGRVIAPPPTGTVAAFEAVRSPLDMGNADAEVGVGEVVAYLPTCNLLVRRDLMLQHGGFDDHMLLGEDVDFIWRVLCMGARARYVTEGQVTHYHRVKLWAMLCRRADYGSSEADLQRRHAQARRTMLLPCTNSMLLTALVVHSRRNRLSEILSAAALASVALEIALKRRKLRRLDAPVSTRHLLEAVAREHGAALYHLGANVTRYYSFPLLAAALRWRNLRPALALLLVPAVSDYYRLKPRMSLPAFVGLYWLELAAYQTGVWAGCLKRRTLKPLLASVRPGW